MLEILGQYKILDHIGAGGLGDVYRARDTRLGRTVAIRVLARDIAADPERRERLLREARVAVSLSHPNIAALYEIGEEQGHVFLASEFVPGETLQKIIAGRPLNPRRAIDLAIQVADALADAHAEGIVHGSIKPDNIIVTPKGAAKILDYGLARAGAAPGAGAYTSPEQALGGEVDQRTDICSLGLVLFEMLTGGLPFGASTPAAVAVRIALTPVPVPSEVNPSLPRELDAIVAKALAKSPDRRYEAAATLAAELRSIGAILDVRSESAEPLAARRAPRRGRRTLVFVLLGIGLLLALLWLWLGAGR